MILSPNWKVFLFNLNNVYVFGFLQIFDLFDLKRNGVIDFGEFVRSLGVFHPNAPVHHKIECMYLFDYVCN